MLLVKLVTRRAGPLLTQSCGLERLLLKPIAGAARARRSPSLVRPAFGKELGLAARKTDFGRGFGRLPRRKQFEYGDPVFLNALDDALGADLSQGGGGQGTDGFGHFVEGQVALDLDDVEAVVDLLDIKSISAPSGRWPATSK